MVDLSKLEKIESPESLDLQDKAFKAKAFLNDTDWYLVRKMETSEEVPEDVTLKRANARNVIKEFKNATQ